MLANAYQHAHRFRTLYQISRIILAPLIISRPQARPASSAVTDRRKKSVSANKPAALSDEKSEVYIHAQKYYQYVEKATTGDFVFTAWPDPASLFVPVSKITDTVKWIELLDRYLPAHLRINQRSQIHQVDLNTESALKQIDAICTNAHHFRRQQHPIQLELFGWMIEVGRDEAALYLIRQLLRSIAAQTKTKTSVPLTNITWPKYPLSVFTQKSIDTSFTVEQDPKEQNCWECEEDNKISPLAYNLLNHVYASLGQLVINLADTSDPIAKDMMKTVMLIFSEIHNLDLMPNQVYSHKVSPYTSFLHRPPIMHLLTSRILTSLSDAAWREHSDKAIAEARGLGMDNEQIAIDPPGGRFRLKVSPLGPEVWIEMILWCCVESGATYPALRIIKMLKMRSQNPWYAIRWTSHELSPALAANIDWDRVQSRHGGPVGLIEGYSREKPLVEMPERTISREVVLALLDLLLNTVGPTPTEHGTFRASRIAQKDIADILSFLEPHDLPLEYLDYLSVRLDQNGALDLDQDMNALKSWSDKLTQMRSLETIRTEPKSNVRNLSLSNVFDQSELQAGMLHQALFASIRAGDFHEASEIFNNIQKLVDQSKLNAIQNFLSLENPPTAGFFSSRLASHTEFVHSHGQLPVYRLAGLINHVSDSNMPGLGKWLIYAEDVDGPLVPPSSYSLPSMTAALVRFAALTGDRALFNKVASANSHSPLKPTVRVLRALVDAHIEFHDFGAARECLVQLRSAQGGGFNSSNIAQLAATIIRLESAMTTNNTSKQDVRMTRAIDLMQDIFQGRYNSHRADFTHARRIQFHQHISHLVRVFQHSGSAILSSLAQVHRSKLRFGNVADLPSTSFDRILSAILDTQNAQAGVDLWKTFCRPPGSSYEDFSIYDEAGEAHTVYQPRAELNTETIPWDIDNTPESTVSDSSLLENSLYSNSSTIDAGLLSDSRVKTDTASDAYFPITVPDSRTLRLILRANLAEMPKSGERMQSRFEKDTIMQWVFERCRELRIHPSSISREIRQSLRDPNIEIGESKTKNAEQRPRKRKFTSNKINPSFRGGHYTRSVILERS